MALFLEVNRLVADPLVVAKTHAGAELGVLPGMANRHGLITGASGTGKTVTLQVMAEQFSRIGVPTFMADVKGDLAGLAAAGTLSPKLGARLKLLQFDEPEWRAAPVEFWDVHGRSGHPVRATISDMGPLLLGRLLNLNDTQRGVLTLVFKIADDGGLLLLDLKDLRAMLQFAGENASHFTTDHVNISAASIGAIQRALLEIEQQGGAQFFAEPMLDIDDLLQTDAQGRGVVNILAADELMNRPKRGRPPPTPCVTIRRSTSRRRSPSSASASARGFCCRRRAAAPSRAPNAPRFSRRRPWSVGHYEPVTDRESAYEKLKARTADTSSARASADSPWRDAPPPASPPAASGMPKALNDLLFGTTGPRGGRHEGLLGSAARSVGSGLGREILRGVLGSILGKRR